MWIEEIFTGVLLGVTIIFLMKELEEDENFDYDEFTYEPADD